MAPNDIRIQDDGDPHAIELATPAEDAPREMIVATVRRCEHCNCSLPPDAAPCPGLGDLAPLGQYAVEQIEWRSDDGPMRSDVPRVCVERYRSADGKVRWPRAA